MRKHKEWAVLPYNMSRIGDKYLVSNFFGAWALLNADDFSILDQLRIQPKTTLFKELLSSGIIVSEDNLSRLINEYRNMNSHLFNDASLHIAVVTTRCNLSCSYCQAHSNSREDMSIPVAMQVIKYLFDVRSQYVNLEFQGGEPLLNWKVLSFLIEHARKFNTTGKDLMIGLVTNGVLLDDKKINFLIDHNVNICISLDGPKEVHDKNRLLKNNFGTYLEVVKAINRVQAILRRRSKTTSCALNLISTITKHSLPYYRQIINEYVKFGIKEIALRPINKIGCAASDWDSLGYTPEEFIEFWCKGMDYILELNKKGVHIEERIAKVHLMKILKKANPGYVDCMNPCGAGRSVLLYMPNGDIFPCDDARMTGNDMFKLGNVTTDKYEDLMKGTKFFMLCESSVMELWDYESAFLPWLGTCPVHNFISSANLVPKISATPLQKIYCAQLRYIFDKLFMGEEFEAIFRKWLN